MSKQRRRLYRYSLRAGEVRQQFERHVESLRLQGVSFDEAMASLTELVVHVLEEQDAATRLASAVAILPQGDPLPSNGNPLLADLWAIPARMSVNAAAALHLIRTRRQATPSELSHALRVSPAAMTGTIDTLVRLGLVTRREDVQDRRKVVLGLTDDGSRLAERIFPEG